MTDGSPPTPPAWFWALLDDTRPNLGSLARRLEELPKEQLIEFVRAYREAAEEVCDAWAGPVVDGIPFSEDDTEDLCEWVVSQGHAFWRDAVGRRGELEPVVRDYWSGRGSWAKDADDPAYRGRQSPQGIAAAVLDLRIGRDPLDAADDT